MKNIKLFDLYSSYVFNELYKNFPKCVHFEDIDKIVLNLENENESVRKITQQIELREKNIIFSETMLWLKNNGFVDFVLSYPESIRPAEPMPYQYFMCVSLTLKGFTLLNSPKPLAELENIKRLGEEIYEKINQGDFIEAGKILTDGIVEFVIKKGLE